MKSRAVPPLTWTAYAASGEVLMRRTFTKPGPLVIPPEYRKRIARTETFDARGVVVDEWRAPWETA